MCVCVCVCVYYYLYNNQNIHTYTGMFFVDLVTQPRRPDLTCCTSTRKNLILVGSNNPGVSWCQPVCYSTSRTLHIQYQLEPARSQPSGIDEAARTAASPDWRSIEAPASIGVSEDFSGVAGTSPEFV